MSSPSPGLSAPRRPVGLILAAIVLALMTCYGLVSGATIIFIAQAIHTPQTAQYPMIKVVQVTMGVIFLLISGFCAATIVGLFRLRRWARYSILILGGLLAISSALFAILCTAFAFSSLLSKTAPNTPGVAPLTLKLIFLGVGGFFLLVSLLGVWWLVYFNLRRIRVVFEPERYPALDRPVPTLLDAQTQSAVLAIQPGAGVLEVLVICLAVLYLFGAASAAGLALLHLPLFFLGFIARGPAASAFTLASAGRAKPVHWHWPASPQQNRLGAHLRIPDRRSDLLAFIASTGRSRRHGWIPAGAWSAYDFAFRPPRSTSEPGIPGNYDPCFFGDLCTGIHRSGDLAAAPCSPTLWDRAQSLKRERLENLLSPNNV